MTAHTFFNRLGKYFFFILTICTLLISGCSQSKTTTGGLEEPTDTGAPTVPESFAALFPQDQATGVSVSGLTLTWGAFSGADNLVLQIDTDRAFPGASVSVLTLEQTGITADSLSFVVPGGLLQGATQYFWRLIARNTSGDQVYGPFSFTTAATCTPTAEVCDGVDNDCDGAIDEGVATLFFADGDGDTFGDASTSQSACAVPTGFVTDSSDCNDSDAAINTGGTEVCDGVDNDCNGTIDDGFTNTDGNNDGADCADPDLNGLVLSSGTLSPAFDNDTTQYSQTAIGFLTESITVAPVVYASASVTVNGTTVASGTPSQAIALTPGVVTTISIEVTASSGATRTYQVPVRRATAAEFAQQAYLKASNTENEDNFAKIALDGDTLVVGADQEDSNATGVNGDETNNGVSNSGAAYVFVRNGTVWIQQAYLKASNPGVNDQFGASIDISGDTIIVGARSEDSNATGVNGDETNNGASNSGAAYIFVRSGTVWTQQAYLKASNTEAGDSFGETVAISGDTAVVSAISENGGENGIDGDQTSNSQTVSGAAYVFVRNGTTWTQQAYVKGHNTRSEDFFGTSLDIDGDTMIVSAVGEDASTSGVNSAGTGFLPLAGAAYVFVRSGTTWTQQAYLKASNPDSFDLFGAAVAVSGDTVVVSATSEDSDATGVNGDQLSNTASSSGAAYVFVRSGTTWTQQAYLKASNAETGDGFGASLSINGDRLLIGASSEDSDATGVNGDESDNSEPDSGAAYLFSRSGTTWTQQAYLKASNTENNDLLGSTYGVAFSGDTIAICAPNEESNATGINGDQSDNSLFDAGAVYIFQ